MERPVLVLLVFATILSGCTLPGGTPADENALDEASEPSYPLAEVAGHDSAEDCWIAFGGKVYDVTEFIPAHPGGNAILEGCGRDATELFETRPMGSGTPHSTGARNVRENFYLGELTR